MKSIVPILSVLLTIIAVWYAAAVWMNAPWVYDQAARAEQTVPRPWQVAQATMNQDRPVLPTPHQVISELLRSTFGLPVSSKKSLVYHAWVTISGTLLGFVMGTTLGVLLAVGIVYSRSMEMSVLPWAIASQMVPIIALAPMLAVVMHAVGATPLMTKAVISAYLSFFPVVVGMVKGLRSPEVMQLDLLQTYAAPGGAVFWKLRLPSSMPYFFASVKVGIAASLVGAIVAELNQQAGLGARLLQGSYYGQTTQIWAALFLSAILAAVLVMLAGRIERRVLARMGMAR
ncbi:MAG: transporter permease [Cypionkella sp.]|uniref:ABC transporter permease n=1 Tax=Cypionkella sp. TaxID=2811411 RepID=UPI00262DAE3A|nr:ABC transporter permease [Cypionkella sp.]MDB5657715.1 transporter permease [Cypionkella sp.]